MPFGKVLILLVSLSCLGFGQKADSAKVKTPKKAALVAMLFPGAGQVYNGKLTKGLFLVGLEGCAFWQFQSNRKYFQDYNQLSLPLQRHRYLEKRNKYAWWMGFIYIYGILDAVVDAHLAGFDEIIAEPIEGNKKEKE